MKKSYYHMKYANYYPKLLLWQHNMKKQKSIFKEDRLHSGMKKKTAYFFFFPPVCNIFALS